MRQSDLETYVETLHPQLVKIFKIADSLVVSLPDTLDDNFQIACAISDIFKKYADKYQI